MTAAQSRRGLVADLAIVARAVMLDNATTRRLVRCRTGWGSTCTFRFVNPSANYCNFNRGLLDGAVKVRYVGAIEKEIRQGGDGSLVDTIYFGGGTPSLLTPAEVARLLTACRAAFDVDAEAEVTLEMNPESASVGYVTELLGAGITRISLGVQSFNDHELERLGRRHTAKRARTAMSAAVEAGCRERQPRLDAVAAGRDAWRIVRRRSTHLSVWGPTTPPCIYSSSIRMLRCETKWLAAAGRVPRTTMRQPCISTRSSEPMPQVMSSTKFRTWLGLASGADTTSSTGRTANGSGSAAVRTPREPGVGGRMWPTQDTTLKRCTEATL